MASLQQNKIVPLMLLYCAIRVVHQFARHFGKHLDTSKANQFPSIESHTIDGDTGKDTRGGETNDIYSDLLPLTCSVNDGDLC